MPSPGPSTAPLQNCLPKHNSAHSTSLAQELAIAPLAYKTDTTPACHLRLASMELTPSSYCHLTVPAYAILFTYILLCSSRVFASKRRCHHSPRISSNPPFSPLPFPILLGYSGLSRPLCLAALHSYLFLLTVISLLCPLIHWGHVPPAPTRLRDPIGQN